MFKTQRTQEYIEFTKIQYEVAFDKLNDENFKDVYKRIEDYKNLYNSKSSDSYYYSLCKNLILGISNGLEENNITINDKTMEIKEAKEQIEKFLLKESQHEANLVKNALQNIKKVLLENEIKNSPLGTEIVNDKVLNALLDKTSASTELNNQIRYNQIQ